MSRPPWTTWTAGVRVVVRRRLDGGGYSDVLGDLLAAGPDGVVVRTRRGDVAVPADEIALGKVVPPAPAPRVRGARPDAVPDEVPDDAPRGGTTPDA